MYSSRKDVFKSAVSLHCTHKTYQNVIDALLACGCPTSSAAAVQLFKCAVSDSDNLLLDLFVRNNSRLSFVFSDFERVGNDNWNAFHYCCSQGNIAFADKLLQVMLSYTHPPRPMLDIDDQTWFYAESSEKRPNQTALHIAAERGLDEVVIFLLKKNANPSIVDAWGRMPSHVAKTNEIKVLIEQNLKQRTQSFTRINEYSSKTENVDIKQRGTFNLFKH